MSCPSDDNDLRRGITLQVQRIFYTAFVTFALVLISGAAKAGSLTYQVSADTVALNGQGGNLDFQFNPGGSGAEAATAIVTNFQTIDGILSQPATLTGDATGSLPSTLTLGNGTAFNDVFQGFAYGSSFSFTLSLSGPALDNSGGTFGSAFALSLYDAVGIMPLLTTDPNGSVLTIDLNANGTAFVEAFAQSSTNSNSVVTIALLTAVPEPSSLILSITSSIIIVLFHLIARSKGWNRQCKCI